MANKKTTPKRKPRKSIWEGIDVYLDFLNQEVTITERSSRYDGIENSLLAGYTITYFHATDVHVGCKDLTEKEWFGKQGNELAEEYDITAKQVTNLRHAIREAGKLHRKYIDKIPTAFTIPPPPRRKHQA